MTINVNEIEPIAVLAAGTMGHGDLRIATEDSEFSIPEFHLGLLPGGRRTRHAIGMIRDARAKELVFHSHGISAEREEKWGLINRAIPEEEFEETDEAFVDDLVNGPPVGQEKARKVMDEGGDMNREAGLRKEFQTFGPLLTTDDMQEGAAALMEEREPEMEGK